MLLDVVPPSLRGNAQSNGNVPRRCCGGRDGPVRDQQAVRDDGRLHVLLEGNDCDLQLDQRRTGHPLSHSRQQEHRDDRPPAHTGVRPQPDGRQDNPTRHREHRTSYGTRPDLREENASVKPGEVHERTGQGLRKTRRQGHHSRQRVRDYISQAKAFGKKQDH